MPPFSFETNLKLDNISVNLTLVKKVVTNLNLSKASCSDSITVLVLKNYEPELSYILAELFNICLVKSCFPEYREVSSVVPVFKNYNEMPTAKNYRPVAFFRCMYVCMYACMYVCMCVTFFTYSFTFFTPLFFYIYVCIFPYLYIFIFSYYHNCIFLYFHRFLFFIYFNLSIICVSYYVLLYMY